MPYRADYIRPPGWDATKRRIMRRDHGICHVCGKPGANEIDHVVPHFEGGSHDDSNLAPIHKDPCHKRKTSAEQQRGKRAKAPPKTRPTEQHPGLIG